MSWILGITIVSLAFLIVEAALLRRSVNDIPCRIIVTGTRGKSSLVKVLLAGIRKVEPAAWGKITGDVPSVLAPDGTASPIFRRGPAHLREQARFLVSCHRHRARCVVMESMAISPEAMGAEMRLMRPSLVIVANVRDDHRETLGDEPDMQRAAYLESLPDGCTWLTRDKRLLEYAARSKRYPEPESIGEAGQMQATDQNNDAVSEILSTALAALDALDWNTEQSRKAVHDAAVNVVAPPRRVRFFGEEVILLDAFSANDTQSLDRLWSGWRLDLGDLSDWSVLLNTRADRPLRTRQLCLWLAARRDIDEVYVTGSHQAAAARLLRKHNCRVTQLPADVAAVISGSVGPPDPAGSSRILVGVGNVQGLGISLRAAAEGSTH
jgi:poly-gamma-glutamate synthase PgsB/CapB